METLERPINSVEDLVKQTEVKYGAMKGGSTAAFFEKSTNEVFQKVYTFMSGPEEEEVAHN